MTTMIERVALAIAISLGDDWESPAMFRLEYTDTDETCRAVYRDIARAAIEAMREPTEGMLTAGRSAFGTQYRDMIDAALNGKETT